MSDLLNLNDPPLNLEQDQVVLSGRLSICQSESGCDADGGIDFRTPLPACCHQHRELHQTDFQPWMQ